MKHSVLLDTSFFVRLLNDEDRLHNADLDKTITHFVTSDRRSKNTFKALKKQLKPKFEIIDIASPFNETFGILDLQQE